MRQSAVYNLIISALDSKAVRRVRGSCPVLGVCGTVHIVIHDIIRVVLVVKAEQLAEAVGKQYRHNSFVYKLINGERYPQLFKGRFRLAVKLIFLHFAPTSPHECIYINHKSFRRFVN